MQVENILKKMVFPESFVGVFLVLTSQVRESKRVTVMWFCSSSFLSPPTFPFCRWYKLLPNNLFVRKISYLSFMKLKRKEEPAAEPTKSELEILQVLWKHGPSTVRFVNDQLNEQKREVQYTSTLKLMQIMVEKALLNRDESQMKHVYSAALEEGKAKSALLERFVNTLYEGSASSLMMHLIGHKKTSKKELEQIKELLKKMDPKK